MDYGTLESDIRTRLNTGFTFYGVQDKFKAFSTIETDADLEAFNREGLAKCIVQVFESISNDSNSTNYVVQEEVVIVRISMIAPLMSGNNGLYKLTGWVKRLLAGYMPSGAMTRLIFTKYSIKDMIEAELQPYLEFKIKLVINQAFDDFKVDKAAPLSEINVIVV